MGDEISDTREAVGRMGAGDSVVAGGNTFHLEDNGWHI